MKRIVENPAPLTQVWPYPVTPVPLEWLLKFTSLGDQPEPADPVVATNSLEPWT